MKTARDATVAIIDGRFGGVTKMSRVTGHPISRIASWKIGGVIPEKYRPGLVRVAQSCGIPHTPFDYIAYMVVLQCAAD